MDTSDFNGLTLAQERLEKAEDRIIKAEGFGATTGAQALIEKYIDQATEIVKQKIACTSRSSHKDINTALTVLKPELIALVAMKGAIHSICECDDLSKTFHTLGQWLDREVYAHSLQEGNKKLAVRLEARARRKGSSVKHRRALVARLAKENGFVFKRWGNKTKAVAGSWLVEVLTELPEVFHIVYPDQHETGASPYLTLTDEAFGFAREMIRIVVERHPVALPLLTPPPKWEDFYIKLDYAGVKYKWKLVRSGSNIVEAFVKQAISDGRMQAVLDAANNASSVAWSINTKMLDVVKSCYDQGIEIGSLPLKDDLELPEKIEESVWNAMSDAQKRVKRYEIAEKKGKNRSLIGERAVYDRDLATIDYLLKNGNCFYTPMNLDYRGRIYGVCNFNFQRQDYVRGLFRFNAGVPLGATGLYWLMVHLANCGDFNKVSKEPFDTRVQWVNDNHDRIIEAAKAPMDNLWWTEADAPFCFLAAAMEYAEAHSSPFSFVSHIPVSFDGTCSGLQHLAAMTRCEVTARLVNLSPVETPEDVYRAVAERVKLKAETVAAEDSEFSIVAQKALAYGIDRGLVKRNVMTWAYSSKKYGMTQQLMEDTMKPLQIAVLRGKLPEHPFEVAEDTFETKEGVTLTIPGRTASRLLGPLTFETIEEVVQRPAEAMRFLQAISKALSHEGKPTVWHTPLGLPVVLHYPNQKVERLTLWMHDNGVRSRTSVSVAEDAPGIDKSRAANAVAPCFVHSYDACHLMMVVNHAYSHGITSIALVHDSFGCHAGLAWMFRGIITDTFAQLYSDNDVLDDILQESYDQIQTNHHRLPNRMDVSTGTYDIQNIKEALYAFA